MSDYKEAFTKYMLSSNTDGSGKATSYVRALDLLCEMLEARSFAFEDCKNVWAVSSLERLHELYLFVLAEARKNDASDWNIEGIPKRGIPGTVYLLGEFRGQYTYWVTLLIC